MKQVFQLCVGVLLICALTARAQNYSQDTPNSIKSNINRRTTLLNSNNVQCLITNFGGVGSGYGGLDEHNFYVNNSRYLFVAGPIVGAEVLSGSGNVFPIISDGINDYISFQELSQDSVRWQWQPVTEFIDTAQNSIAVNPEADSNGDGKPDSWPEEFYSSAERSYSWPSLYNLDESNYQIEAFWIMDDRANSEFEYYPVSSDSSIRGLGIRIEGRAYQLTGSDALDNAIIFHYKITNISDYALNKVVFGMYVDPDIGGGSPENNDDSAFLIPPRSVDNYNLDSVSSKSRNLLYAFDRDMMGENGKPLGYFGCKILESVSSSRDAIDNDDDGMADESMTDGIDNDRDWNPATDDVGIDGIPNTGDPGEGDEIPTAGLLNADGSLSSQYPGEPNFEMTDRDESDDLGLSSCQLFRWGEVAIKGDDAVWEKLTPGNFSEQKSNVDVTAIMGSGYFPLIPGQSVNYAVALFYSNDYNSLLSNAGKLQDFYNNNFTYYKKSDNTSLLASGKVDNFYLSNAYPNPFNPETTIEYNIPVRSLGRYTRVTLKVYDILGGEIATLVDKEQQAGRYRVSFNASVLKRAIPSGVYFYRLNCGLKSITKKFTLLK